MRSRVYGRQSAAKEKSIAEQLEAGEACSDEHGWTLTATYQDGSSASRFGSKTREEWERLCADVRAKTLDVLILWESSRGDRTLSSWAAFLDDCRTAGVRIHVVTHNRTYDMNNLRDWKTLAEDGISNAYASEETSIRVLRGQAGGATKGNPSHGRAPYGHQRTYDPAMGVLAGQSPHPDEAPIAAEIVTRVSKRVPVSVITRDLNDRKVPTREGGPWHRATVRKVAANVAHLGLRKLNGKTYPGQWPALVEEEVFWAAQAVLGARGRKVQRPGRQKHLLSYYGACTVCDGVWSVVRQRYVCSKGCASMFVTEIDGLVEDLVIERLCDPEVYAALKQQDEDINSVAKAARDEAARLAGELADWRKSAWDGRGTTPESLAAIEAGLQPRIDAATAKADAATVPAALDGWLGRPRADVAARWAASGVPARRSVLRALGLRVRLRPTRRPRRPDPVHERVDVSWA